MGLFFDTANIDEIEQGVKLGVISGVTTNPSLAAKEGIGNLESYKDAILRIAEILPYNSSISVEVTAQDTQEMIRQSREISEWHPSVIVKLPSTVMDFTPWQ